MVENCWRTISRQEMTRRRFTAAAGSAALGAAALNLIGCGSGSNQAESESGGTLAEVADTSKQAVPGGIYQASATLDITGFDVLQADSTNTYSLVGNYVYSRLLMMKPGHLGPSVGEPVGDLAESWEFSNGGQTLTVKLRGDALWDQRPPTSSRRVDSGDVVFSWDKYATVGRTRGRLANQANPAAPVLSVTAPDNRTVVFKLAFPFAVLEPLLGSNEDLWIEPVEADGKFDAKGDARGSGAWYISKHTPSVAVEYRRNPNWYRKDRPFMDGYYIAIVPEYATALSQFRAGSLWSGIVRQEDIIATRKDLPDLLLHPTDNFSTIWRRAHFAWNHPDNKMFRDVRVRRAVSMSWDRDLFLRVFGNADQFEAAGLPFIGRWDSHVAAGFDGYWLDPLSKDFGEGGRYFKHDPAEAKRLLSAAGFPNGFDTQLTYIGEAFYGRDWQNRWEVLSGMMREVGIRCKTNVVPYQNVFLPIYSSGNLFAGMSASITAPEPHPVTHLATNYRAVGSPTVRGDGGNPEPGYVEGQPGPGFDTKLNDMSAQLLRELDRKKSVELAHEFQRYLAVNMYDVPMPGGSLGYTLTWPWVKNLRVYRSWVATSAAPQESSIHLWIDQSHPKFRKG